jgi:hypothetical protein
MKKAIIVGCNNDFITKSQLDPFFYSAQALKITANLSVKHFYAETFAEIGQTVERQDSDVIFLMPSWRESLSEEMLTQSEKILQKIRSNNDQKIIFIDPFSQTTSNFFNLLPYVDSFLKRQPYKDINNYKKDFTGGSMLTDFLNKKLDIDLKQWYVGSKCSEDYINRINVGWNLGTNKKFITELHKKPLFWFDKKTKSNDIFCRLSLGNSEDMDWYQQYRLIALNALKTLETDYKVITSARFYQNLVPHSQYLKEIRSSRIVFSPFGWGEACFRDFEAVCYDCLLVKPLMDHIHTEPNIYIDGETYVSVNWDFSNLVEKCQYFLENPDQAARIITNARQAYTEYFRENRFVQKIKDLIE